MRFKNMTFTKIITVSTFGFLITTSAFATQQQIEGAAPAVGSPSHIQYKQY